MIRLHALFSDNMVLQQDRVAPVWGWTSPGEKVTVRLGRAAAMAVAGPDASADEVERIRVGRRIWLHRDGRPVLGMGTLEHLKPAAPPASAEPGK